MVAMTPTDTMLDDAVTALDDVVKTSIEYAYAQNEDVPTDVWQAALKRKTDAFERAVKVVARIKQARRGLA